MNHVIAIHEELGVLLALSLAAFYGLLWPVYLRLAKSDYSGFALIRHLPTLISYPSYRLI